jgi:ParB/RepB/Spo0J family partition protein
MVERETAKEPTGETAKRQGIGAASESGTHKPTTSGVNEQDLSLEEIGEVYGSLRLSNPRAEKQMQASLERYGQMSPVVVCRGVSDQYELLDGFKRLRASRQICHLHTLRARVLTVGARAAKAAVLCLNWVTGSVSALEEGWVVYSLVRQDGLMQMEVAELLGRGNSWVSRRLSLVERLSDEVQSQLRLGLITATMGRELARLPCGKQEQLLSAVTFHGLGSRETGELVALINASSPTECKRILQSPREALAAQGKSAAVAKDPRLSEAGNHLFRDLSRMERACTQVTSAVGIDGLSRLRSGDLLILAPAIGQAERAGRQASEALRVALVATGEQSNDDVQQS